jgi:DNA processing protein
VTTVGEQVRQIETPKHLAALLAQDHLDAVGNVHLLEQKAIGICGSRNASNGGLERAYEFGREAALKGAVVVSGYAKGVDRQAHLGALEAGGATIAVLPDGISHFRTVKSLKLLVDFDRNFLALSMFHPDAPWRTWQAMARNKLIVGLSRGLFVIEARERGGTIAAADESRRQRKPVYVVHYRQELPGREGNKELLRSRAVPVRTLRDLRSALDTVLGSEPPEQLDLFPENNNGVAG